MITSCKIKVADLGDVLGIFRIYNWYVLNTAATMDSKAYNKTDQRDWLGQFSESHPVWCIYSNSELVGWGGLKKWSDREGYKYTVELSIYLDHKYTGRGFGKQLIEEILSFAKIRRYRAVLIRINGESSKSIRFYKKFGFFDVGTMRAVGHKFGKSLDIKVMQKLL